MEIDFDAILAEVTAQVKAPSCQEREKTVTTEEVRACARAMAARGYIHTRESLEALRYYAAGYGILFMGNVGVGKTYFFRTVAAVRAKNTDNPPIVIYPMIDIVGRRVEEIRECLIDNERSDMVLDDVGAEPTFNEYGNRWEILPWLLEMRRAARGRTHFTTNLSPDEMAARYGARTVDRMQEMAVPLMLTGSSRRMPMPKA